MKKFIHSKVICIIVIAIIVMFSTSSFASSKNISLPDEIQTNDLTVSRTNIMMSTYLACSDTFVITSNVNWTITITPTANSTTIPTWLSVTPVSGSNNMIINLVAAANTTSTIRGALVKITYGNTVKQVEVHQPAYTITPVSYLNVSRTNITLPSYNACTDTFAITSNVTWNISVMSAANTTTPATWLTVTPVSGSNNLVINMAATANTSTAARVAYVVVTSGTLSKTIEVHQPASSITPTSYLNVSRTNIALPSYNACTDTFKITSNVTWNITIASNSAGSTTPVSWLTVSPINGSNNLTVNLIAAANTTSAVRTAFVVVSYGTITKTIEVKQPASSITPTSFLNVSRTNITLPSYNACTDTFKITSNVNWTVAITPVTSTGGAITWLTVNPVSGSNNLTVNLIAAANTTSTVRTAFVVVTYGAITKTIEVKQPASSITPTSFLNVSRTNITLPSYNACTDTFAITSNVIWNISVMSAANTTTPATWLTVTPVSGSNNLVINMAATANTTTAARVAYVVVTSGTLSKTIEVHQPAYTITPVSYVNVSRTNIALPSYNACNDTFKITSNVNWTVAVTPVTSTGGAITWLTVNPISGSNNLTVNLVAAANTTSAVRTAFVVVSSGTITKTIEVKQPASSITPTSYLYVSRTNITLPSYNACTDTFKITSNVTWNVAVTPVTSTGNPITWLTVNPVSGSNNLTVNLVAAANTTSAVRTAFVVVSYGTITKTIEVKQPVSSITPTSYLNVSRTNITLPSYNACSDTFKITSNVNWSIIVTGTASNSTIPTWLSVNPVVGANNLIINMNAAPNTSNIIRTAIVKIMYGTLYKQIEVKQPAAPVSLTYLNVSKPYITLLSYNACSDTFAITSNVNWNVSVLSTTSSSTSTAPTWLTINPVSGSNNMVVTISVTANSSNVSRIAYIKVYSGTLSKLIVVKQVGISSNPGLPIVENNLNFQTDRNTDKSADNGLVIYPNPTKDYILLNNPQEFKTNDFVEIYSLDGRKVLTQQLIGNNVKLDIQNFKNGIYFVKINQNNEIVVKTISKN